MPSITPATLAIGGTGGQVVTFAPARLQLLPGGAALLTADSSGAAGNGFTFQFTPTLESEPGAEVTRSSWTYGLTSPEEQPTNAIRSGADPENGLRPLSISIVVQQKGNLAQISLQGRFVSLSATDPQLAPAIDVQGTFQALVGQ
jgi:hypothetical protein